MFYMDLSTDTRRKVKLIIIIAVVVDKIQKVGGLKKKKKMGGGDWPASRASSQGGPCPPQPRLVTGQSQR